MRINKIEKIPLILLIILSLSGCVQFQESNNSIGFKNTDHRDKSWSFPLKTLGTESLVFQFAIPDHMELKTVSSKDNDSIGVEFMPIETTNLSMWEELINFNLVQKKGSLSLFMQRYKEGWEEDYKEDKSFRLESNIKLCNGIPVGHLIIDKSAEIYGLGHSGENLPQTNELHYEKIVYGISGMLSIQYIVRYSSQASKEEKENIKAKMKDFINSCEITTKKTEESFNIPLSITSSLRNE